MKVKYFPQFSQIFILFLFIFIIKIVSIYLTPLDSDEVMWSVMAERILKFEENYWFFTNQVFRGSLEAYLLAPFQYLFGVNEATLRINNIIFSLLTIYLIYKILFYHSHKKFIAVIGVLIYFISLPGIFFIQNKAWGGYVTIQFLMLLIYYLVSLKIDKKISKIWLFVLTGLLTGFSFWINEQSIFFLLFLLPVGLYYDYHEILKETEKSKKILYILFFIFYLLITYFIIKKRMFLNLNITLQTKFGLETGFWNQNIYLKDIILFLSIVFIAIIIYEVKKQKYFFIKSFLLNQAVFAYLIMYINLYFNSFSRISAPKTFDIQKSGDFFVNVVLHQMLGPSYYIILPLIILFFALSIYLRIKKRDFQFISQDLYFGSFFAFPIMFIFSFLPGLAESPRYLILWWPIVVICLTLCLSKFNYLYSVLGLTLWILLVFYNNKLFYENFNLKINQDSYYKPKTQLVKQQGYKYCVSNYWTAGILMFYSNLEVKCFTDKKYGVYYKFLDRYKVDDLSKVYINN